MVEKEYSFSKAKKASEGSFRNWFRLDYSLYFVFALDSTNFLQQIKQQKTSDYLPGNFFPLENLHRTQL